MKSRDIWPKVLVLVVGIFIVNVSKAQLEANIWYVSDSTRIDWNKGKYPFLSKPTIYAPEEGTGSICDSLGNLLFYCSAKYLFNAKNELLNKDFDLNGDESTTQGALILKHKESAEYYLFVNSGHGDSGGLFLTSWLVSGDSVVFTAKGKRLLYRTGEGINAINHQNGRDIWIITHGYRNNLYYIICLTNSGLSQCIKYFKSGPYIGDMYTANNIWIAPDGSKIGFEPILYDTQYLYKFNSQIGAMGSLIVLPNSQDLAMSFSSSGNFIYSWFDFPDRIFRRNLSNWNEKAIRDSRQLVATLKSNSTLRWPRVGYDDIIVFPRYAKSYIGIVSNASSDVIQNVVVKDTGIILLKTKCTNGNFNTNQSYFYTPAINYKYKQDCNTNEFHFWGVDTFSSNQFLWEIKKGNSISKYSTKSMNHQFTDTGIWQVKYVATNGSRVDSVSKDIEIFPILKSGFLGKDIGYCGNAFPITLQGPKGMNCYTWSKPKGTETYTDHINADTAGTYILETCNPVFCTYTDTIKIFEKAEPDTPKIIRKGDSLFVSNAEPGVQYQWYKGNTFTGKTGIGFKLLDTAWYKVRGVAPVNCFGAFDSVKVESLRSMSLLRDQIQMYPNPVSDEIHIRNLPSRTRLSIFDVTGRLVYEVTSVRSDISVSLSQLPAGHYQLAVEAANERMVYTVIKL